MNTNNYPYFPARKNQGEADTCQAHALSVIAQAFLARAGRDNEPLAPLFPHRLAQIAQSLPAHIAPSMENIVTQAQTCGLTPERLMPYGDGTSYEPSAEARSAASSALLGAVSGIPVDPYNGLANALQVRAALERGHLVALGFKLRRWFALMSAPEEQHLAIARAVVPGSLDDLHIGNHCVAVADFYDGYQGQGLAFVIVNSRGERGDGNRTVQIVGPQFFKDAIRIDVFHGFAGCNDRYTYDADGQPGQVYRLYQAAFNREPDKGGLGFQIDALAAGRGLQQLASDFLSSPEGEGTYPSGTTDAQFVDKLYDNVLHRPGDAHGRANHLADLATGTPRRDKLLHFSESPENKAACAPAFERGVAYT